MNAPGVGFALTDLRFDLPGHTSGKVRESWMLPGSNRLIVTSDRLSAFDRVVGVVPNKGQVLNQTAAWWFDQTSDIVDNHVVEVPDPIALIAVDAKALPVEVVVRGRLTGSTSTSLLPRYAAGERDMYGHLLPDGLTAHGCLPEPIITPTTKAQDGQHDQPISIGEVAASGLVERTLWEKVQTVALELFSRGVDVAADAGFVLADTKYEFGLSPDGDLLLIDEVHTPDSSRYWSIDSLEESATSGNPPESFDKEPVRLALRAAGYTGDGPPPQLPDEVWQVTSNRYVELFERLLSQQFIPAYDGKTTVEHRLKQNLTTALEPQAH